MDSPEFESSRNTVDDKFKVSINATCTYRLIDIKVVIPFSVLENDQALKNILNIFTIELK